MSSPNLISFIARSKRKMEVLKLFSKGEKSQPEIMKLTGLYKSHTSRVIKELIDKKLIICTNPEDREFKFHKISPLGKNVLNEVERLFSLKQH